MNVGAVIKDRFARWGQLLCAENATPIIVVGVTYDDFVLCTVDTMTDPKIREVLVACINIIDEGRRYD